MSSLFPHRFNPVLVGFAVAVVALVATASPAEAICERLEGHGANNGQNGNAFELQATNDIIIRHFEVYAYSGSNTVEVWYNPDSMSQGHASWEYLGEGTFNTTSNGHDLVPVDVDIFVPGGETVYFCVVNRNQSIRYTNGGVADISDANLTIDGSFGYGGSHNPGNTPPMSFSFSPRVFAGAVLYEVVDDPHLYVTYNDWSLGCQGARELDVGTVSDDGVTRVTLDLTNIGDTEQLVLTPPFDVTVNSGSFSSGPDANQVDSTLIDPGESAKAVIEFQPDAGTFEFVVEIHSNDPNVPDFPVTIVGEAVAAQNLEVYVDSSPVAHNFVANAGAISSGQPLSLQLELLNSGAQSLDLGPAPIFDIDEISGSYSASPDVVYNGATTIAGGTTEVGDIEFTVDTPGPFLFSIEIANDDPLDSPYLIYVGGYADPGELGLELDGATVTSGQTVDIGTHAVDMSHSLSLLLENVGVGDLTLASPAFATTVLDGDFSSDPDVTYNGPSLISPSQSETAELTFTLEEIGSFEFTLQIASDDPDSPFSVTVVGEGTRGILLVEFDGEPVENNDSLDLGSVGARREAAYEITLHNVGYGDLNLGDPVFASVNVEGAFATGPEVSYSGPTVIPAGASETAELIFSLEESGQFSFGLQISSDDPDSNPFEVAFTGEGVALVAGTGGGCTLSQTNPRPMSSLWPLAALMLLVLGALRRRLGA